MMEPFASIVDWSDGNEMTVWTSNQMIEWNRQSLATTFGIDADKIRVESPYIGGGFGLVRPNVRSSWPCRARSS